MQPYINLIFDKGRWVLNNQMEYDPEFHLDFFHSPDALWSMQNIFHPRAEHELFHEPYHPLLIQIILFEKEKHIHHQEKINSCNRKIVESQNCQA